MALKMRPSRLQAEYLAYLMNAGGIGWADDLPSRIIDGYAARGWVAISAPLPEHAAANASMTAALNTARTPLLADGRPIAILNNLAPSSDTFGHSITQPQPRY